MGAPVRLKRVQEGVLSRARGASTRTSAYLNYSPAVFLLEHQVGRFVAEAEAVYPFEGAREMNTLIVGRAIGGLSAFV